MVDDRSCALALSSRSRCSLHVLPGCLHLGAGGIQLRACGVQVRFGQSFLLVESRCPLSVERSLCVDRLHLRQLPRRDVEPFTGLQGLRTRCIEASLVVALADAGKHGAFRNKVAYLHIAAADLEE